MKRTLRVTRILVLLLAAALVLLASCATKPAPQPEPQPAPQPAPEPKPAVALPEKEYAEAQALKARVDRDGLAEYAPEEYKQAEAKLKEAEGFYKKDNAKAKAALDQSIAGYKAVIAKAFSQKTDKARQEAEAAKADADALKAAVAMKDAYAAALAKHNEALAAQKAGEYEKAIALFGEAKAMFEDVYRKTQEKKAAAEAALQAAQDSQAQSEQKAEEADTQLKSGQ